MCIRLGGLEREAMAVWRGRCRDGRWPGAGFVTNIAVFSEPLDPSYTVVLSEPEVIPTSQMYTQVCIL